MAKAETNFPKSRRNARRRAAATGVELAPVEREQHGGLTEDAQTDRPGIKAQRAVTPIDRLCRGNTLSEPQRQHSGAIALCEDYEVGALGARSPAEELPEGVQSQTDIQRITDRQIEAHRRYKAAMQHVGVYLSWPLEQVVVRQRTAEEVASLAQVSRQRIVGQLDVALLHLADYYGY